MEGDTDIITFDTPTPSSSDKSISATEQQQMDQEARTTLTNFDSQQNSEERDEHNHQNHSAELAASSGLIVAIADATLELRSGELTCIIGEVGGGKSALLQMLAGELPPSFGSVRRRRSSIAYAPQDPWIMDGTVRENILLGRPYLPSWYKSVVIACSLDIDFAQLRRGEDTTVGDRGVQLSGGQRARIALARAFYRDADVLLLDDPLSAVDSKVGRHLFYEAIVELGVKRNKCVVLVTHQHRFLERETRCIWMHGGRIECDGSYWECVEASGGRIVMVSSASMVSLQNAEEDEEKKSDDTGVALQVPTRNDRNENGASPKGVAVKDEENEKLDSTTKVCNISKDDDDSDSQVDEDSCKEMNQVGNVQWATFFNYMRAMPGGLCSCTIIMILFAITQGSVLASVAATGKWSELPADEQTSNTTILWAVGGLVGCVIVLAVVRAFASFVLTVEASRQLHDDMTMSVLRARIEFFDTNPLGRILNRFSADVGSNDDLLPVTLFDFLVISFMVVGALISAVTVLPVTLIFVPPLVWYFLRVRRIFVTTSRELKRIEGLARSPIFAMLSESLSGIATIRSNDAVGYFQDKFRGVHDAHGRAFFAFIACSRWLGFRMDSLMFIFLAVASFASVLVHDRAWFAIDPGILGLALSMVLMLGGLFQWCIRQSAEVVNQMVAVERVIGFRDLPSEAPLENSFDEQITTHDGNAVDWPSEGTIYFENLSVRYRPGLPLSLRGISFRIEGGFRVGVVGRTGGGKSTLVQSLLRLLEAESGQILIDGVNIARLGLHKLRKSISVIPQSPVLYGGCSLRENLDPFGHFDDDGMREALSDVHMLDTVEALPHGLDSTVAEGGLNFSVGQRQLLCLARAILRKNKILVLDEPTANVDSRTDQFLQEAVAKSFANATIISVAHRLDTVIDYDRILVLGSGTVLEYGSPHDLIQKDGTFAGLVKDTGREMAFALRSRAEKNNRNR